MSIDIEGIMIFVSLDGYIEKKFSVERSASHIVESMDVIFSAYEQEREMFLVRRNLNTTFFEFQKIKAGVQGYFAAYDVNSFPTILKNKPDKRRGKIISTHLNSYRFRPSKSEGRVCMPRSKTRQPDNFQKQLNLNPGKENRAQRAD